MEKKLKKLYTNPLYSSAFAGAETLYQEAKKHIPNVTKKQVLEFLEGEASYTLHKPQRIHFKRSTVIPAGYHTNFMCDLADFQKLSRFNKGYRFLLLAVDVFSKMVYTAKVKSKKTEDMKKAFEEIFKKLPMLPHTIYTDKGMEFESKQMREFFEEKEIIKTASKASIMKASTAERFILVVKNRLYKYFTHTGSKTWIDVLPKIVDGINKSKSRVTGMRAIDVNFENSQKLWKKLYSHLLNSGKIPRYNSGDHVRMSLEKGKFAKGYVQSFSDEVVEVERARRGNPPIYRIKDLEGEPMDARFYEQELQKVNKDKTLYVIEKKYKSRIVKGKKEWLVKFRGYSGKFWVKIPNP